MRDPLDDASAAHATLDVDGSPVTIRMSDAETIRAALIARLEHSTLPDREHLLSLAKLPIALEAETVQIGAWSLFARGSELKLFHRLGTGSAGLSAYEADLTKQSGAWQVSEVEMMSIHPRR